MAPRLAPNLRRLGSNVQMVLLLTHRFTEEEEPAKVGGSGRCENLRVLLSSSSKSATQARHIHNIPTNGAESLIELCLSRQHMKSDTADGCSGTSQQVQSRVTPISFFFSAREKTISHILCAITLLSAWEDTQETPPPPPPTVARPPDYSTLMGRSRSSRVLLSHTSCL